MPQRIRKLSKVILGIFGILLFLIFIINLLTYNQYVTWFTITIGLGAFFVGLSEAHIFEFYRKKEYKKLNGESIGLLITQIILGLFLFQVITLVPYIYRVMPDYLITYTKGTGIIISIVASILIGAFAFKKD